MRFRCAVFFIVAAAACGAAAQSIQGTATYPERMAWSPTAVFEAMLEDVSRADVAAEVIARTRMANPPNPPIRFEFRYDRARIQSNHAYVVRARILVDERAMFVSDTFYPVLTRGNGNTVSVMMRRADSGQTASEVAQGAIPTLDPLPATFAGTLPCADCPAVRYQLNLFSDRAFFLRMTYQDRNVTVDDIGRWLLSSDGRILLLKGGREAPLMFAIRDGETLRLLGAGGEEKQVADSGRQPGVVRFNRRATGTFRAAHRRVT